MKSILLVDDDPLIRRMMERVLTSEGYVVVLAESAEEALDRYVEYRANFALVLSDYTMPGANGSELYREVRGLGYEGPFILMTAEPEKAEPLRSEGVTILPKLSDMDFVIKTIAQAIGE